MMNNLWQTYKIGDICTMKYGKMPKKEDLTESGYPVFSGYRVVAFSKKYLYKDSEIVVVARGVGGSGNIVMSPQFAWITNLSIVLQINDSQVNKTFLYYQLFSTSLKSLNTGSAQFQIVINNLKEYQVKLPNLNTQRKIASILSAYDDLIENNTRRIKILEEMAQMLYREWFVNFRFPNHENVKMVESELGLIPEGWIGKLEDALILQRGFDLPHRDRKEGNIPIYAATGIVGTHSEAKVKAPCVITGRSGSLGTVLYIDEDFWALNTTLWTKEFRKVTPIYAFYLLSSLGLEQYNSGAAVPTLNRNDIHGLTVLIPSSEILKKFDEYILPLFQLKKSLTAKNINLRKTRDLLLPKLISGEIDVENLDIETVAAAA
jgi:type I restriction enzyme S subunit